MRVEVIMPQMGESIVEGTIVAWHKKVGDKVERDEDIFTIQTDKVDAEIPSPTSGILVEIIAQVGETIDVGKTVAVVDTDMNAVVGAPATAAVAEPSAPVAVAVPAAVEAQATPAAPVVTIDAKPDASSSADDLRRTRSTPLVRKIAEENGILDLSAIAGTGVSGRVTKQDILAFLATRTIASSPVIPATPAAPAAPAAPATSSAAASAKTAAKAVTFDGIPPGFAPMLYKPVRVHVYDGDRVEPLSRMRAAIAENMINARRATAHCHTVWEVDVTNIIRFRKANKAEFESKGANLTLTAFFVQAVAEALRAYPIMNAAFDGESIVYRGSVNVGIASALEDGLIVPVLKSADGLNLFGVARGINDLAARSKSKKLVPTDVTDGTFTISNSGVFGSLFGIPILVTPQVGILNIGGIQKKVTADEQDNIRIRSIATMCLTFDHRVIDGATADGFCGFISKRLADWK
jgi:2-oxoglutarate dehydrogenase E2 component (dihydrolipoamide succinyltransferase)